MIDRESFMLGFQAGVEAKDKQIENLVELALREGLLAEPEWWMDNDAPMWDDAVISAWKEHEKKGGKDE